MNTFSYDVVVIGGGSGGYAAARTARDAGATVAIADRGPLGGLCILRGCMPSKTLIASGDVAQEIREAGALGVTAGEPQIDFRHIVERKREIIRGFADYRIAGLESFPLYAGDARFLSPSELAVGTDVVLRGKTFVIATGSDIAPPVLPGLAETGFIDSDAALDLDAPPASLIVLGGGYVATELGQFYKRIGSDVSLLARAPHLLSREDRDVGDALTFYLRAEGMRVETDVELLRAERRGDRKVVHYMQDGAAASVAAEEIFFALGRLPRVEGLNLEAAGVIYHAVTGIEVGPDLRTSNPNVFAVGDVTGIYELVHVAIYQGEIAARNAVSGGSEQASYDLIKTRTVFTDPQVAIVGETEKELEARGVRYLKGAYLFSEHGKAISINKTKGFVKMLAAPDDGRILGAAIVGPNASDLIHEVIVAMFYHGTVRDFLKIPHLHPTMAEILTYPPEDIVMQMDQQLAAAV